MPGTTKNMLKESYQHLLQDTIQQIGKCKAHNRGYVVAEIATFLGAVAAVVLYTMPAYGAWTLAMGALLLAVYAGVRRADVRNSRETDRQERVKSVLENELSYLDGDYSHFADGRQYINPAHPFSFDLDLFGDSSLFQRLCRTVTTGGSDQLAHCLTDLADDAPQREERRRAIGELARLLDFRIDFMATSHGEPLDTTRVKQACNDVRTLDMPSWTASPMTFAAALVSVAGLWTTIALSLFGVASLGGAATWWAVGQFFVVYMACSGPLRKAGKAAEKLHEPLKSYARLMRLVRDVRLEAPYGVALQRQLADALPSVERLEKMLKALDRRGNLLGLVLADALFASDFMLVRRFLRWQRQYGGRLDTWIEAMSDMDALVSMSTFRYNEPQATEPEVVGGDGIVYEARGLWHPFLGEKAVTNDFTIDHLHYYIITGANMAGKSTFLRTIGVNYVLAMAGLPVFARSLRVSVFALFTSMRTTDDLTRGVSYFNAELLRLRQLLEAVDASPVPTLIILDEILKGTNSLDKLNGSRLFLEFITRKPVSGIIATHDLELSRMADEHPDRFHNYCFEIALTDHVTYSYRITPGVARNQNATFLLKNMLKATEQNDKADGAR